MKKLLIATLAMFAMLGAFAATELPVSGAAFHVDASAASTMTLVNLNGTNFVTRWNDASGGSRYASIDNTLWAPWIDYEDGLPFVDFGPGRYGWNGSSPTGYLKWSSEVSNIREVFLVYSDYPGASGSFLLSHNGNYKFHRNGKKLFHSTYADNSLKNGLIEVDGESVAYASYDLPEGFHIIHLRTTGNVSANRFASDRDQYQIGAQRLREVIVYSSTLSDENAALVYAYLSGKWTRFPNAVMVAAEPAEYSMPSPDYGQNIGYAAGQQFEASVPAGGLDAASGKYWSCTGYEVWHFNDASGAYVKDTSYAGIGNSFTYTHPDPAVQSKIVWKFSETQALFIPGTSGVTASGRYFTLSTPVSAISALSGYTLKARILVGTVNDASQFEQYGEAIAVDSPSTETPLSLFAKVPAAAFGSKGYAQVVFDTYDSDNQLVGSVTSAIVSADVIDNGAYTWQAVDNNWAGDWSDAAHWAPADPDNAGGLPVSTSTVEFPVGKTIIVSVTNNYTVKTVKFSGFSATDTSAKPNVTFIGGPDGTNKTLTVSSSFVASQPNGQIVFDNIKASLPSFTLGINRLFRLQNAAFVTVKDWTYHTCGGTFEVAGSSTLTLQNVRMYNSTAKIIIDDATLRVNGTLYHAQQNVSTAGGTIVFKGKSPLLYFAGKDNCWNSLDSNNSASKTTYTFEIPEGGYTAAPIRCISTATKKFAYDNGRTYQNLYLEVADNSPCYLQAVNFTQRLVDWSATGICTNCLRYAELPDGGAFSYDSDSDQKSIDVNIVSPVHNGRLTVRGADGESFAGVSPAFGASSLSDTAVDGKITFSAPVTTADGITYTATGYTLDEIVKTASGSLTNRIAATSGSSYEYTVGTAEVLFTWTFAKEFSLTPTVINDAGGSVTVSTADGISTLTASTVTDGMEFQYWYGDIAYADRYRNPLTVDRTKMRNVYAFFGHDSANGGTCEAKVTGNGVTKQWFDTATWTGGVIPGTNDTASVVWTSNNGTNGNKFRMNVPSFFAVKDLFISNAIVRVASTFTQRQSPANYQGVDHMTDDNNVAKAADMLRYEPIGCDIFGDLVIDVYDRSSSYCNNNNNGVLVLGGRRQQCPSQLLVLGDLTVRNGTIEVYAGYRFDNLSFDTSKSGDGPDQFTVFDDTREMFRGRNFLRVLGDTTLETPTTKAGNRNVVHVVNDDRTGVAVWLDLQDVYVGESAAFSSYNGGYYAFNLAGEPSNAYSFCPGGKQTGDNKAGGSHGGKGGSEATNPAVQTPTTHDTTYDYVNAPIYPGNKSVANVQRGAGSIRMDCSELTLDGWLYATGSGVSKGGTAGGSIWVVCEKFTPGENCMVAAEGGTMGSTDAGGGGGRISICEGLTSAQVEQLFTEHEADDTNVSQLADKLTTRCSVEGGQKLGTNRSYGFPGTAVYIVNTQGKKTLSIVGDPENFGTATPGYGTAVYDEGTEISFAAPDSAYITDDHRAIRAAEGYVITDSDNGETLKSGTESSFTWTINKNATLIWQLTSVKRKLVLSATDGGTITTNSIDDASSVWQDENAQISLTAVPADGYVFAGWTGEIVESKQYNATAVFGMEAARDIKAVFVSSTANETAQWTGEGDGSSWFDGANWSTGKVPGPGTAAVVDGNATVTISESLVLNLRSLTVAAGSTVNFNGNGTFTSTSHNPKIETTLIDIFDYHDLGFNVSGDVSVGGTLKINRDGALGYASLVAGGSITVAANAAINIYGGWNPALKPNVIDHWREYGAIAKASGLIRVDGTLHLAGEGLSGSPCLVESGRLVVGPTGKLDSYRGGWFYREYATGGNENPGPGGIIGNNYSGGAYAGFGGSYNGSTNPGARNQKTYGEAMRPYMPGSTGGHTGDPRGGGSLRIKVAGTLVNDGIISSCGHNGEIGTTGGWVGGSGGSLWISANLVRMNSADAYIAANGGSVNGSSGPGGGGRVLVCVKLSDAEIDSLYETAALPAKSKATVTEITDANMHDFVTGTLEAKGGQNTYTDAAGCQSTDGTFIWIEGQANRTLLILR